MVLQIIRYIKFWTPTWGAWLPIQLGGLYAICNLIAGLGVDYWWAYTLIGYILLSVFGISVGYHRYLSHNSFKTNHWICKLMLWCGIMSGQGSPIFWPLIHRRYHHKVADTPDDVHSPLHGFWHSYVFWLFRMPPIMDSKYTIDLIQNKDVSMAHKFYFPILWISNAVIFYLSYDVWLWGIILPGFLAFHSYALNTSINHYPSLGYRYYPTNDNSTNVLWLWPCLFGDAWHNNHHADPKNPNFSKRWWEIDPAYWLIKLIRTD